VRLTEVGRDLHDATWLGLVDRAPVDDVRQST
jgi:hypothetical protein